MSIEEFSLTCTQDRHNLLMVCFAIMLWTTHFLLMEGEMEFVSNFISLQTTLSRSVDRWIHVAHYVRVLLVTKKIGLDR